jgi:eukaryotic-like serine/threonine-protein kinase
MHSGQVAAARPPANGVFFAPLAQENPLSAAKSVDAVVGSLVLDRFLIERRIGSGGFGTVYEAWDGRLERSVAVKAIESRGEARRRVLREAQAAARLNHPGIVTLYEMGEEDGNALLVTEMVEGDTLASLSADGVLSDRAVGEIGADLCEALDHAHTRGVVHRDVKPQNVLVEDRDGPRAKLMDFGVARLADAAALTAPGDVVGTLAYMAPEQAEGRPAGPEADVYSLALTLYECWGGENPNRRSTPAATARAIGGRPRSLRRLRPDLPRELCDTMDACLDRRPGRRPGLEQLGAAIEDSLDGLADSVSTASPALGLRAVAATFAVLAGAWLAAGPGI